MRQLLCITATALVLLALAAPVHAAVLNGTVVDDADGSGVPALTITVKASRAAGGRESATSTNSRGAFRFPSLADGRYLLTVSRGHETLYRKVVTVQGDTEKEIRLKRR